MFTFDFLFLTMYMIVLMSCEISLGIAVDELFASIWFCFLTAIVSFNVSLFDTFVLVPRRFKTPILLIPITFFSQVAARCFLQTSVALAPSVCWLDRCMPVNTLRLTAATNLLAFAVRCFVRSVVYPDCYVLLHERVHVVATLGGEAIAEMAWPNGAIK